MKTKYIITALLISTFYLPFTAYSQTINWSSLKKEQKHILNINAGLDYAINWGAGYGYQLKTKLPVVLQTEFSVPSGSNFLDDFKTKIGGQVRIFKLSHFAFSSKIQGIFRRFENPSVRLVNFGSLVSGEVGYYKPKWFFSAEIGFDKAIVTHFKHSQEMKDNFPGIRDGWYEPATGGNFSFGLQTGLSFKRNGIYLKGGKLLTQDLKTTPFIPYYAQLGYNMLF